MSCRGRGGGGRGLAGGRGYGGRRCLLRHRFRPGLGLGRWLGLWYRQQGGQRTGNGALLRLTWVRSARHANQSPLERLAGFSTLIERLDTGRWPDTSPDAMNARAQEIRRASTIDLGPARFIAHEALDTLRPWDGRNWGTYKLP